MRTDWLGNTVTTTDDATLAGIDALVEGFLAYETRADAILPAADADPGSALANAYAAMFMLFLESRAAPALAATYLTHAEAAAPHATPRERAVVAAIRAWHDDDIPRAIAIGEQTAREHPRELALAKVTQYHHFNRGDAAGMRRIADAILPANTNLPYAHGLAAFALEQSHELEAAEAAARRAMALKRKEPWAHHALAHVMLATGRTREGREFLEDVRETWTGLNSFMLTHNWWHLALVLIEQHDHAAALDAYDRHIWGVWKDYSQDQVNAVSLLARLEFAGVDVGNRWQDVADHLASRVDDHVQPFLSLHYLYGLARAGRIEADLLRLSLDRVALTAPLHARKAWAEVALPVADGMLAFARGHHAAAASRLAATLPRLHEIGGSHAQRDLWIRMNRVAAAHRVSRFALGLFALNADGGLTLTRAPERWPATWPRIAAAARLADTAGLDFLLPIARWKGFGGETNSREHSFEGLTFAAALAGITDRIALYATVHTPMVHPVFAAKAIATLDHASAGRAGVNIVCGWNPEEFAAFGLAMVEDRYAQGAAWLDVVERVWAEPTPFDAHSPYFRLAGVSGRPAPLRRPTLLNAAFSPPGRAFAAARADILLTTFTDHDQARVTVADVRARAEAQARDVRVYAACHIVCRKTQDEADAAWHRLAVTLEDTEAVDRHMAGKATHSGSHDEAAYRLHRARFAAGAGTYPLVGTPAHIAADLATLEEIGFAGAALAMVDYNRDLAGLIEHVLPLLHRAGLR